MKAETMNTRPNFSLLKMSDVISYNHLQMPRWLFSSGKYKALSLEAKVGGCEATQQGCEPPSGRFSDGGGR